MTTSRDDGETAVSGYFVPLERRSASSGIIDVRELIARFRWLLVSGPIIGAILLVSVSLLLTPQYRVEALLAPVETSAGGNALASLGGLGGLEALAGISLGGDNTQNEAIAVLESKSLTTGFLQDNNLLPVLFADKWNAEESRWTTTDTAEQPSLEDAFRRFDNEIRAVTRDRETGLVTLSITWSDRNQAAAWANQLVERVNREIRTRAIDEAERSIDYLNEELEKTTVVGVRQAIYSVIESQIEQVMLANVREDYAFKVLDPAVPPDADDTAYPRRVLFAMAGFVVGLAIAASIALLRLR